MRKNLYIKEVKGKGRGVFCNKSIACGEIIEVCPVVLVPASDIAAIKNTKLADYCFCFNKEENTLSLAMGFGSIYNCAQYPNAAHQLCIANKTMIYTACQDIPAHTEISINYSGEHGYDFSKWFTDRNFIQI